MSKSLGNYVGIAEPPDEMFGKGMSISDTLMWRYYLLLTDSSEAAIESLKQAVASGSRHPKDLKVELARQIVGDFHGAAAAARAARAFDARFSRGELAAELPDVHVEVTGESIGLARLVTQAGLATSTSEATRKIQQGGVKVDRVRATDLRMRVPADRSSLVLEVGRRAVRVHFRR
jgi:tyrosyl-tRNA synthetase